jgi:formylglycine-generating enzyme required for sulfatase activity
MVFCWRAVASGSLLGLLAACDGAIPLGSKSFAQATTAGSSDGSVPGASPDGSVTDSSGGGDGDATSSSSSDSSIPSSKSCAPGGPGMTDCGSGGRTENCCLTLPVTGGTFYRTYQNDGTGPTAKGDPATISSFWLDKYLVTVGRFRQFVAAWNGGWMPTDGSGKHTHLNGGQGLANTAGGYEAGWDATDWNNTTDVDPTDANLGSCISTWTSTAGTDESLPINCVTWYEAYAFCIWDGGFLPSDAEGEYAAAGGREQRQYPWGQTAPGTMNQYAISECNYPTPGGSCSGLANIAPVGSALMGAGRWGQLDLAGDVSEWNLDEYQSPYVDPCTDCANLSPSSYRVIRGGDFFYLTDLQSWARGGPDPSWRYNTVGLRCARSP